MAGKPLVSVGVPTCNRAALLGRALKSLVAQDYPNLEIAVSDNASTDDTTAVCADMQARYPFIHYSRNPVRILPVENFRRALSLAKGEYFMWAADDDLWEPNFVSTLIEYLESNDGLALVAAEARYVLHDGTRMPFFAEGRPFYKRPSRSRLRRLLGVVAHNYGNLLYGIYRREALLLHNGGTVLDSCRFINENPIFLHVAARGGIQVCSKALFCKTAVLPTYLQAARECGFAPYLSRPGLAADAGDFRLRAQEMARPQHGSLAAVRWLLKRAGIALSLFCHAMVDLRYHLGAWADIRRAIFRMDTGFVTRLIVLVAFAAQLVMHFLKLAVVWQVQDVLARRMGERTIDRYRKSRQHLQS